MLIRHDCRHFLGDRPCLPHKREGVHCANCPHYETVGPRILIIKLDALGDVLRSTCILGPLHKAHPGARLEWLTNENALPFFEGNPLVRQVHAFPGVAWIDLLAQRYDLVINLDNAPLSSKLATLAQGVRKVGFGYDATGHIHPFNEEAREWYHMGLFDDIKRVNRKTYQQIALEICGLPTEDRPLHLYLRDDERAWAAGHARTLGLRSDRPVIGFNTGASDRWEHKKWTEEGFIGLVREMQAASAEGAAPQILLLGGPREAERNARIAAISPGAVFLGGSDNSLRQFFALVDLCDLVVTGDTLALHVAAALGKKVVALFGPTSEAEIDLYGRGIKLASDAPCVGGYRTRCDVLPTCMERIGVGQVHDAIRQLLTGAIPAVA